MIDIQRADQEIRGNIPDDNSHYLHPELLISDSINFIRVQNVFDKYGYPSEDVVGGGRSGTSEGTSMVGTTTYVDVRWTGEGTVECEAISRSNDSSDESSYIGQNVMEVQHF